jgi:uncharacterized membrane protein YfcA
MRLFDSSLFAALLADPRIWAGIFIAALSGAVKGFTGFGSALIYVPLMAAVYDPRLAAVTLLLIDFFGGLPLALRSAPQCDWRDLMPVWLGAIVAAPFGAMILLLVEPTALRWGIAALVLACLPILASGWRYHGRPVLPVKLGVGALAGLTGGAVQISGPPVITYWLGSRSSPAVIRANLLMFFELNGLSLGIVYVAKGLLTADAIALSLLLGGPFLLAMVVGARWFRGSSDQTYRRVAYIIIAAAALLSIPVFDGLFR